MLNITLLDAVVVLFVLWRLARGFRRPLGESLHDLIGLLLLLGLFFGFRMAGEIRALLAGTSAWLEIAPSLGAKLLMIVGAWYLLRLLRRRAGGWLEGVLPRRGHRPATIVSEGARALLLVGFLLWLVEGWFEPFGPGIPQSVQAVRLVDAYAAAWAAGLRGP